MYAADGSEARRVARRAGPDGRHVRRDAAAPAARSRCGRGPALLRPSRHRRRGDSARASRERRERTGRARRQHHHPAGRQEPLHRRRAHLLAQGQGSADGQRPGGARRQGARCWSSTSTPCTSAGGTTGSRARSRHYFGKSASSLTLAEAATLAGIIKSPTRYCPLDHPEAAARSTGRRPRADGGAGLHLARSRSECGAARAADAARRGTPPPQRAPYFVEYVKQDLIERFGAAARLRRRTSRVTRRSIPRCRTTPRRPTRKLSRKGDPEVALVAVRHTDGQVLALVGGRDFAQNQFNLAVQGRRQPGSAFKPFVLATALQQGVKPGRTFSAAPYSVRVKDGIWNVQNYENEITAGRLSLNAATDWSVNAVYARLIMQVGSEERRRRRRRRWASRRPLDPDPAIALGGLRIGVSPLEMASAYGTIANRRRRRAAFWRPARPRRPWRGRSTSRSRQPTGRSPRPTAVAGVAHAAQRGREGHRREGQDRALGRGQDRERPSPTETHGSSGWSGDISTAVWVGHRDGQVAMTDVHGIKVTGGSFPAMIWADFMKPGDGAARRIRSTVRASRVPSVEEQVLVRVCEDSLHAGQRPAVLAQPTCTSARGRLPRQDLHHPLGRATWTTTGDYR